MGRTAARWLVMIITGLLMVFMIFIFFKRPAKDRAVRRTRTIFFLIPLAVFIYCAFWVFGEHGGMSLVKEKIEELALDEKDRELTAEEESEGGVVVVTVSGKNIKINGKETDKTEELQDFFVVYNKVDKVKVVDDFAISSVFHEVIDVLELYDKDYEIVTEAGGK